MGRSSSALGLETGFPEAVRLLASEIASNRLLGAQVAVLVGGELVLDEALGARDLHGASLKVSDRVPWFCASKTLLGIGAMRELERRSVPLSTPVHDILPQLRGGGRGAVRLRHLLDHTAGIRLTRRPCSPLFHDYHHMLSACVGASLEPGWVPGEDGGYHIWQAAYVLAEAIERVSGRRFEDLIDRLVLEPAGVTDVIHGRTAKQAWATAETVTPHRRLWDGRAHELGRLREGTLANCPGLSALGPISSLARVLDHVREMTVSGDPVAVAATTCSWTGRDRTFGFVASYGLGLMLNLRQLRFGSALPERTFGHAGWDCTLGLSIPELAMSTGLFLNGGPTTGVAYRYPELARPVVDAIVETMRGKR